MHTKSNSKRSKRQEKILLGFSLLGVLLFSIFFVFEFFSQHHQPNLGEISQLKNDVRFRTSTSPNWGTAKSNQLIQFGDSIFAGISSLSQVNLRDGLRIDMGENSMMVFAKIEDVEVPNLTAGNFLLSIKKRANIGIDGDLVELDGDGSQVQIFITGKSSPVLRLIRGNAQVTRKGLTTKLAEQVVVSLIPETTRKPIQNVRQAASRIDKFYGFAETKNKDFKLAAVEKKPFQSKSSQKTESKIKLVSKKYKRAKTKSKYFAGKRKLKQNTVVKTMTPSVVKRQPAEEEGVLVQKLDIPKSAHLNSNFSSSKVSLEGAAFTMVSKEQLNSGKGNPTALLASLNWLGWKENIGAETSLKAKIMDVATASDAKASPLQIETRVHYRWLPNWNPFSKGGGSQISVFAGYEYYRNSAAGSFSPKYDLIKTGLALDFPLLNRWDTGGEFVYGMGFDKSTKYEISGRLSYYFTQDLSMGFGYRIHLFEAGSAASSPFGLPYREAFGDGFSGLKWHY